MKKLILCVALLALSAGSAFANAAIPLVHYQCLACREIFYSFDGDDLTHIDFITPEAQDAKFAPLSNRGKKIMPCKNSRGHIFSRIKVEDVKMSDIAASDVQESIVIIKGGKNLNHITLSTWYCLNIFECSTCKVGSCYTLNNENLIIKDLEKQTEKIVNVKTGKGIPKCGSKEAPGHALWATKTGESVTSEQIATLLHFIYWVQDN